MSLWTKIDTYISKQSPILKLRYLNLYLYLGIGPILDVPNFGLTDMKCFVYIQQIKEAANFYTLQIKYFTLLKSASFRKLIKKGKNYCHLFKLILITKQFMQFPNIWWPVLLIRVYLIWEIISNSFQSYNLQYINI